MKRTNIFFATLIVISSNAFGLDIQEAIQRAVAQSHTIKASQLKKEYSKTQLDKAYSKYRPSINLKYTLSSIEQNDPDVNSQPSSGTISLGYNLFDGFSSKYGIKRANESVHISHFQSLSIVADIKLNVELAYIDFLQKRRTLEAKKEAVELLEKSLKDTQAYYDQGLLAKNSLLETKVSLSNANQDLLSAKSDLFIAKERLNRLLGGTLKESEEIREIEFRTATLAKIDNLVVQGLNSRNEIRALKATMKAAQYQYDASQADLFPKIDVNLAYEVNGNDGKLNGRDVYYDDQGSATLSISYNLYQGGAYEADRVAYMKQKQIADENLKALKLDIGLQIKQAVESYKLAVENRKVAIATKELAQENFSIMKSRYKAQLERTTDFLNARLQLTEAKIGYANSIYNVYSKYARLLRALGKK